MSSASPIASTGPLANLPQAAALARSSPAQADFDQLASRTMSAASHARESLRAQTDGQPEQDPASMQSSMLLPSRATSGLALMQSASTGPRPASRLEHAGYQLARHLLPVGVTGAFVRAVPGFLMGQLVRSHPQIARSVQAGLAAASAMRLVVSRMHSERYADLATENFVGRDVRDDDEQKRQGWQALQSFVIVGGNVGAIAATHWAKTQGSPWLVELAAALSQIQVTAELLPPMREMGRSVLNGVHVGNRSDEVPQPPNGHNLESGDFTATIRAVYGSSVFASEFAAQFASLALSDPLTSGHDRTWLRAVGIAVFKSISGLLQSSVEDFHVDERAAEKMRQTHPSHVVHVGFTLDLANARKDVSRLLERVDARASNQMFQMAGTAAGMALRLVMPRSSPVVQRAVQAVIMSAVTSVLQTLTLPKTVQTYQLNDGVRANSTRPMEQDPT